MADLLRRDLESSGQSLRKGPERATYRGVSAELSKVKGLGVAALSGNHATEAMATTKQLRGKG